MLEQALWDIRAQQLAVPLHDLLGGAPGECVPLYANINRGLFDRTPEAFAERAREAAQAGFRGIKCAPFDGVVPGATATIDGRRNLRAGLARIAAVRAAVGPDVLFMVDCHGRFDAVEALALARELEPYALRWFEEPVSTLGDQTEQRRNSLTADAPAFGEPDTSALERVSAHCALPLAGGEFNFGVRQFEALLTTGALDVLMPDIKHCGGIWECLRIATVAQARGVSVSLHNPSGAVATLGSGHVSTACAAEILEYQYGDVVWRREVLMPAERIENGSLVLSRAPGLGAAVDEIFTREFAIGLED